MRCFDQKEVAIEHTTGAHGAGGTLKVTHLPTGLSVWRDTGNGPIVRLRDELLDELARKVAGHQDLPRHKTET